jgi:Uma2 family endonuclease
MPTLVRDPQPAEFEALLEKRRRLGQDLLDEVWEGVLHMNPAPAGRHGMLESQLVRILGPLADATGLVITGIFNLGDSDQDYRVPDLGLHRNWSDRVWYGSAALVVEIVSPGDETFNKFEFYAGRNVDELLIVDPQERKVRWLALQPDAQYLAVERSALIELGPADLAERIDWPT